MITYQHFHCRYVQGQGHEVAAAAFVGAANREQPGTVFVAETRGDDSSTVIDLEDWPEGEPFGDWFVAWAERFSVTVHD